MKQKIVDRFETWEEKASISHRSYSWSQTRIEYVLLECEHMMSYRGMRGGPKYTVDCKKCDKRTPPPSDNQRFEQLRPKVKPVEQIVDPIARAMFDNLGAKASITDNGDGTYKAKASKGVDLRDVFGGGRGRP